ncbi:MAG: GNAT family N-acetyltransferase [Actinomycetaceae bacterium]|nr:GNAT family N-acetyltransferase [Actinomycetaceae bacterium]
MGWLGRYLGIRPSRVWGVPIEQLTLSWHYPAAHGLIRPEGSAIAELRVSPALGRDIDRVEAVRLHDRDWLAQWEATLPPGVTEKLPTIEQYRIKTQREAEQGITLPMMIEADGEVIGLVTASNTVRGAMYMTTLGYWITSEFARLGITSLAVAAVIDLLIGELGMHRVEINIRPENTPSLGLAKKLQLREEGYKKKYMCIAGRWADHVIFAMDAELLPPGGLVRHLWGDTPVTFP